MFSITQNGSFGFNIALNSYLVSSVRISEYISLIFIVRPLYLHYSKHCPTLSKHYYNIARNFNISWM